METSANVSTGELLRRARRSARLSQTELAERAHVAQSVISAYENELRAPSLATLDRLIRATGYDLVIELRRNENAPRTLPDSRLGRRLRRQRDKIVSLSRDRGISNVRVFGSVARGDERDDSDVDLVVDVGPHTGLFALAALRHELTTLLGAEVDLVPYQSLRPRVRDEVLRDAVPL